MFEDNTARCRPFQCSTKDQTRHDIQIDSGDRKPTDDTRFHFLPNEEGLMGRHSYCRNLQADHSAERTDFGEHPERPSVLARYAYEEKSPRRLACCRRWGVASLDRSRERRARAKACL